MLLEFHGSKSSVEEQSELFNEISKDFGGDNFEWSSSIEERNRLWKARHDVYYAVKASRPKAEYIATDVCVPISRLSECIMETIEDMETHKLYGPIVGHVGDGNFHVQLMVDPKIKEEVDTANAFLERLAHRAINMDGTCTGEHGVGQGKKQYLIDELGPAVDFMKLIKQEIDPKGIMNPGKILQ